MNQSIFYTQLLYPGQSQAELELRPAALARGLRPGQDEMLLNVLISFLIEK